MLRCWLRKGLFWLLVFLSLWLLCSKERAAGTGSGTAAGIAGGHHREAWTTKGPSYEDLYTQNVVISMEDQEDLNRSASEGKPARERPIWLRESTVQGAYDPDEIKDGKKIDRAEVLLCLCDALRVLSKICSPVCVQLLLPTLQIFSAPLCCAKHLCVGRCKKILVY